MLAGGDRDWFVLNKEEPCQTPRTGAFYNQALGAPQSQPHTEQGRGSPRWLLNGSEGAGRPSCSTAPT